MFPKGLRAGSQMDTCIPMIKAALFTITKRWKLHKNAWTDKWRTIYACMYVCMHVYTYTHTHTHIYTHHAILFSYCSWGSQGKNPEVVCHSLLQWTTFCQISPPWPTHLGLPSCNTYRLTWVSLTLGVGYLFMAAPAKRSHCSLSWTRGISSQPPLLTLNME